MINSMIYFRTMRFAFDEGETKEKKRGKDEIEESIDQNKNYQMKEIR